MPGVATPDGASASLGLRSAHRPSCCCSPRNGRGRGKMVGRLFGAVARSRWFSKDKGESLHSLPPERLQVNVPEGEARTSAWHSADAPIDRVPTLPQKGVHQGSGRANAAMVGHMRRARENGRWGDGCSMQMTIAITRSIIVHTDDYSSLTAMFSTAMGAEGRDGIVTPLAQRCTPRNA